MNLLVNGDKVEVPDSIETMAQLIKYYQLDKKVLIVEHNLTILNKEQHQYSHISDGDKIEIVNFVGGG
ncbi:sulfur carrier protein ThiS [Aquibacillus rhizosphaerae]|uniref:Sulfur carrier protein ThiS n=1 Tax=Aquibacillus rhizosphaerae TaxID=3051431 RepID=A0ABT7L197_9BACI|nr:sulfur carrier protein ThiS [Aquibacillus sp. LR5S19]MDL4839621.1 sulfur carrier protein ThiS [Aquibacillus sp. LR5S19]